MLLNKRALRNRKNVFLLEEKKNERDQLIERQQIKEHEEEFQSAMNQFIRGADAEKNRKEFKIMLASLITNSLINLPVISTFLKSYIDKVSPIFRVIFKDKPHLIDPFFKYLTFKIKNTVGECFQNNYGDIKSIIISGIKSDESLQRHHQIVINIITQKTLSFINRKPHKSKMDQTILRLVDDLILSIERSTTRHKRQLMVINQTDKLINDFYKTFMLFIPAIISIICILLKPTLYSPYLILALYGCLTYECITFRSLVNNVQSSIVEQISTQIIKRMNVDWTETHQPTFKVIMRQPTSVPIAPPRPMLGMSRHTYAVLNPNVIMDALPEESKLELKSDLVSLPFDRAARGQGIISPLLRNAEKNNPHMKKFLEIIGTVKVIGPKGSQGMKSLKKKIKDPGQEGKSYTCWELKVIGMADRLLGICCIVYNDVGEQHTKYIFNTYQSPADHDNKVIPPSLSFSVRASLPKNLFLDNPNESNKISLDGKGSYSSRFKFNEKNDVNSSCSSEMNYKSEI